MAKTVCEAKRIGEVKGRGRPSIEWHKNGVPQYYCCGYIDCATDELLEVCRKCVDHVDHAQEDFDAWKKS